MAAARTSEGNGDNDFMKFKQDNNLLNSLYEAGLFIDHGYSNLLANCQEIELADATKDKCFSRAVCFTSNYTDDIPPLAIGALFGTGIEFIKRFVTATDEDYLPADDLSKEALKKLLTFLSKGLPEEFFHPEIYNECQWTVIIAQHLLSKLSLQSDYTIDDDDQGKKTILNKVGKYYCVCHEKDLMVGKFGDTSFGCPNGWHGFTDILFKNSLPTLVAGKETGSGGAEEEDDDDRCSVLSDSSESSIEEKSTKHFTQSGVMQMISQCITFSFLQKKTDSTLKNNLIPALGISKRKLKVIFYDCDNDILLTSEDLDFIEPGGKLNYAVITLLWLTLNYKIFCTGVPDYFKKFKAKFDKCVGDRINAYREDVHYEFSVKETEQTETKTYQRGTNFNPVYPFPPY